MELFYEILIMLALVFLAWAAAEFTDALTGKQKKTGIIYFSFLGVSFTQKDIQRLILGIFLGIILMVILPYIETITGYKVNGYIAYIVAGFTPLTLVKLFKKKVRQKTGISDIEAQAGGGELPGDDDEEPPPITPPGG